MKLYSRRAVKRSRVRILQILAYVLSLNRRCDVWCIGWLRKSTFTWFITMQPWGDPRDDTRASRYTPDYPRRSPKETGDFKSLPRRLLLSLSRDTRTMASFLRKAVFRNARNSSRRNLVPALHRSRVIYITTIDNANGFIQGVSGTVDILART